MKQELKLIFQNKSMIAFVVLMGIQMAMASLLKEDTLLYRQIVYGTIAFVGLDYGRILDGYHSVERRQMLLSYPVSMRKLYAQRLGVWLVYAICMLVYSCVMFYQIPNTLQITFVYILMIILFFQCIEFYAYSGIDVGTQAVIHPAKQLGYLYITICVSNLNTWLPIFQQIGNYICIVCLICILLLWFQVEKTVRIQFENEFVMNQFKNGTFTTYQSLQNIQRMDKMQRFFDRIISQTWYRSPQYFRNVGYLEACIKHHILKVLACMICFILLCIGRDLLSLFLFISVHLYTLHFFLQEYRTMKKAVLQYQGK